MKLLETLKLSILAYIICHLEVLPYKCLEKPSQERKCILQLRNRFPQREIVRWVLRVPRLIRLFSFPWERPCFLSLYSEGLSITFLGQTTAPLGRQPSFFPRTLENETLLGKMNSVFTPVSSLRIVFLNRGNIYSSLLEKNFPHSTIFSTPNPSHCIGIMILFTWKGCDERYLCSENIYSLGLGKWVPGMERKWRPVSFVARRFHFSRL